jgi:NAD(P)-dependent dehydrogenase (short-subunit alcohol dehydrogenase family)
MNDTLHELFGLEGRTAIVTGASAGLGVHLAEVLRGAGANVVVVARRLEVLEERFGGRHGFLPMRCDVTSADDRERVVQATVKEFGSIDVLVNNAGIGLDQAGTDDPIEAFRRIVEVDLVALFAMSHLVSNVMRGQGGGSIVNISSVFGLVASAPIDGSSYCAAKGGVINLTRQQGAQLIRRGIRVNSIAPGFFLSDMNKARLASDKSKEFIERQVPIGRHGKTEELDAALLFLAGPGSSYVAGQTIVVDGGWTAR